jgi:hypothetical protein
MLSSIAKVMLTSTAIAPVLVTYAWVAFQADEVLTMLLLLEGCILLLLACIRLLHYTKKNLERVKFSVTTVEAADRENMGFLLLYLLPLFTAQFESLNWQIWIPTIIVFAAVVATGYSYHFNPLLGLMGWHFYKVGTKEGVTYILITKKQLRNTINPIEVAQLTEYIVIDLEGE